MELADYEHARDGLVKSLKPVSQWNNGLNMTLVVNRECTNPVHVRASFDRKNPGTALYREEAQAGEKKGAPIKNDMDFANAVLSTTIGGRHASTATNASVMHIDEPSAGGDAADNTV